MARRVFAYECRYCGKLFKTYKIAERHEVSCLKNPDKINCVDCYYFNPNYIVKLTNGQIATQRTCMKKFKRCSKAISGNCTDFTPRGSESAWR